MSTSASDSTYKDVEVDKITGLQPSIAIEQRTFGNNPRSTVGTLSKINSFLKVLYTNLGQRICPKCHNAIDESNVCKQCGHIAFTMEPHMFTYNNPEYMCPSCKGLGLEMKLDMNLLIEHPEKSILDSACSIWGDLRKHKKKPNANWQRGEVLALAYDMDVDLEVPFKDLPEDFRNQILYGSNGREVTLNYKNSNGRSGEITRPVEGVVNIVNRLFSEKSSSSSKDHILKYMSKKVCESCSGERLIEESRLVNIRGYRYPEVVQMNITDLKKMVP